MSLVTRNAKGKRSMTKKSTNLRSFGIFCLNYGREQKKTLTPYPLRPLSIKEIDIFFWYTDYK